MSSADKVLISDSGHVRRVLLNRPEKLNAMNREMTDQLWQLLAEAVADEQVRVIVISGSGRAFCVGADIGPIKRNIDTEPVPAPPMSTSGTAAVPNAVLDMVATQTEIERWLWLRACPKPTIAQVHGYCLGIGNELAGCCDLVVSAESAQFGMPEARDFALPPTLGFWPQRIGIAATKQLLWTGDLVPGREAARLGLSDEVVADDQIESRVDDLATSISTVTSERLAVVKRAVEAWSDAAGATAAARRGAEYHALYHQVSGFAGRFPRQ